MSIKHWTNDFTKECNKFLTNGHEESLDYCCGTYLWGNEDGVERNEYGWISFRVPGATRGWVKVANDLIVDIEFDEETCFGGIGCYKKDVEPYIKAKFIGTEFDLPIVDFARE